MSPRPCARARRWRVIGRRTTYLLGTLAPRRTLVVSGSEDKYSRDADDVVARVGGDFITHPRVDRGHALDQERFDAIVAWLVERAAAT